jgi:hypothetical protein
MKNKTHTIDGEEWEEVSKKEFDEASMDEIARIEYFDNEYKDIYLRKKKQNVFEKNREKYKVYHETGGIELYDGEIRYFVPSDCIPTLKKAVDRAMEILEEKKCQK